MITLITGAPGAGKTAACVELLMRFAEEGRPIFVNGIPDLKITHLELKDPHDWMAEVPDGSVIVIDEVQRIWRPTGSGSSVPASIEALETHRHAGIEFIVMTQHPNLMHANVRRLCGRHIHLRDLGFLGRHWYEWPEAANPESWKNALVKKRFKLPKKTFRMYKSASMHVKPVRSVPRSLIMFAICVPLAIFLGHRVYARVASFTERPTAAEDGKKAAAKQAIASDAAVAEASKRKYLPVADAMEVQQEPVKVHLAGCIKLGARCECIDQEGFWATVEVSLCEQSSGRSGLAIPYAVVGAPPNKKPAGAGSGSASRSVKSPAAAAPGRSPVATNQASTVRQSPPPRVQKAALP